MQKYIDEIQQLQALIQRMYDSRDRIDPGYDPNDPMQVIDYRFNVSRYRHDKQAVLDGYQRLDTNKNLQMYLKLADSEFLSLYKRLQMHMRLMEK